MLHCIIILHECLAMIFVVECFSLSQHVIVLFLNLQLEK
jgi:hypothetical protein